MDRDKPKLSAAQNLGDVGETTVQLIFKKFKWTADIIKSDFGEDIDCNIFIDSTRTNYHLRCQVKSTTKDSEYVKKLKTGDYSVAVNSNLLRAWLSSFFPVFLIVYEEDSDLCYWSIPVKQILENPSKLEKKKPTIRVSKDNLFNVSSKAEILNEVELFYRKILRLEESKISCKVTPVLMPNYRIIPFHHFAEFIYKRGKLKVEIAGDFVELLPSWMTVFKRLDPSNTLPSIRFSSAETDLEEFITLLKDELKTFSYPVKNNEWISFVISPIEIQSDNSSWVNQLTFWECYSLIDNKLVIDFDYTFETPSGFLGQVTRRARSWDYCHCVHPQKDIAIQFFGCNEITPSIQNIDKIHDKNIKGQIILWECKRNELEKVANVISENELSLEFLSEEDDLCLVAITTQMFNPFIGLYSVPMDWDSFDNGSVRNILEKRSLKEIIPGTEHQGKTPSFLEEIWNRFENKNYTKTIVTEMDYIPGIPLMHNEREIKVSRFQMIHPDRIDKIETTLKNIDKSINKRNLQIDFAMVDNSMWQVPIYELSISWFPDIKNSSKDDYLEIEEGVIKVIDEVLPTQNDGATQLKDTFQILHIAGEIGFEDYNEE